LEFEFILEGDTVVNSKAGIFNAIAAAMTSLFLASCTGSQPQPDNADPSVVNPTWGQAIVKGQRDHLQAFDKNLRQILGLSDLEANQIGCVEGCDEFANAGLSRLLYVFPREYPEILSHFGKAWDQTQKPSGDGDFALELNADLTGADCTGIDNPPPCSYMPFCAIDRCGRMVAGKPNCSIC